MRIWNPKHVHAELSIDTNPKVLLVIEMGIPNLGEKYGVTLINEEADALIDSLQKVRGRIG